MTLKTNRGVVGSAVVEHGRLVGRRQTEDTGEGRAESMLRQTRVLSDDV